ncbi:MAG: hypothetical protein IPL70_11030 [Uliginosibacterium sp.]|nr:hypothetical protein [Uliginosibacterium sp.]
MQPCSPACLAGEAGRDIPVGGSISVETGNKLAIKWMQGKTDRNAARFYA